MSILKKVGCYVIAYIAMASVFILASAIAFEYDRRLFHLIIVDGLVWSSIAYSVAAITNVPSSKLAVAWVPLLFVAIAPFGLLYNEGQVTLSFIFEVLSIFGGVLLARVVQVFMERRPHMSFKIPFISSPNARAVMYLLAAWGLAWSGIYFFFAPLGHPDDHLEGYLAILAGAPLCVWFMHRAYKTLGSRG